jgi:hypothetical protein
MREKSKIQATQIKILRAIMEKTKRDRIRNAYIREELRKKDIQNQTEGNRLRWYRHIKRIVEHRLPK